MNDIPLRLDQYILQLKTIQKNLENIKNPSDPNQKLGEDLVSKGIGMIAEELFESETAGKLGQKWVSNKFRMEFEQKNNQFLTNQEYYFHSVLEQIRGFLATISIEKPTLKQAENSNSLLKKFASIDGYTKLETKIKKTYEVTPTLLAGVNLNSFKHFHA